VQTSSYVRCLLIDFSKAFDVVDHPVLLAKMSRLYLPANFLNWLISLLSGIEIIQPKQMLANRHLCPSTAAFSKALVWDPLLHNFRK